MMDDFMMCIKTRDEAKFVSLFQDPVLWTGVYTDRTYKKVVTEYPDEKFILQIIIKPSLKVLKTINRKKNLIM
jgi:hypothetical protein